MHENQGLSGVKRLELKSEHQAFEITGSEVSIKKASEIIQDILQGNLECIGEKTVEINIPTDRVRDFIGLKGRNIKQLQIKTETYIEVKDALIENKSCASIKENVGKVTKAAIMVKGLIANSSYNIEDIKDAETIAEQAMISNLPNIDMRSNEIEGPVTIAEINVLRNPTTRVLIDNYWNDASSQVT